MSEQHEPQDLYPYGPLLVDYISGRQRRWMMEQHIDWLEQPIWRGDWGVTVTALWFSSERDLTLWHLVWSQGEHF